MNELCDEGVICKLFQSAENSKNENKQRISKKHIDENDGNNYSNKLYFIGVYKFLKN